MSIHSSIFIVAFKTEWVLLYSKISPSATSI